MRKVTDTIFSVFIKMLATLTVLLLAFVIYFIVAEAIPLFGKVSIKDFLFGSRWMPIDSVKTPGYGIFNFIVATVYVSVLAMFFAVLISIGAAIFLSCVASERIRNVLYACVDLLAGIPSVIYGFIGLVVLVKGFLKLGHPSGLSVLAAALVLTIMILPFLISAISDTMLKVKERYMPNASALGVEKWYIIATVILPLSMKSIFINMVLAMSRAMGETMAVMMVIGNANLFPRLLGKSETISSLIALEMGSAVAGSTHYNALYASGLVLIVMLLIINVVINKIQRKVVV
jgi:phosphate ABC transporter, permease protein PstC